MPVHSVATLLGAIDSTQLIVGTATIGALGYLKTRSGGRKCTWERDWAGKMVIIVAIPTPVVLSLIDYLLNLPRPPQILFLPPLASPLPEELLTILHTIRLSATNSLAQLHCEPLPRTPIGVRDFTAKWGKVATGMTGEGGRRIDAIVLGSGWEVTPDYVPVPPSEGSDVKDERHWNYHEYHFHFLTSLLPALIRQPAERNIRIISLVSPTYTTALPTLLGKPAKNDMMQINGAKSITTLLLMQHVQLVLDTLAAAALKKAKEVPNPDKGATKKRDENVQSNVMALSVVMPWTRDEVVRGFIGVEESWLRWLLWIIFYPLLIIITPSPRRAIQSIIFALQAPVRYGPLDTSFRPAAPSESQDPAQVGNDAVRGDPRRAAIGNGDVVRDCAIADMPPVLSDRTLAKVTYDSLEKAVEQGVKDDAKREKAFGEGAKAE